MKLTLTLTDEQLATIKQVQGPDFDLQRLAQNYLNAKVETDQQMLDVLEKPDDAATGCAWDNTSDPAFDGCAGCSQNCNYRPFLCRTEDLKVNNELP